MASNFTFPAETLGLDFHVASSRIVDEWSYWQDHALNVIRTLVPYHYIQVIFAVDSVALLLWHLGHLAIFASFYAFANPVYQNIEDKEAVYSVGSLILSFIMFCMALYHMSDPPGVALHARDAIHFGFPAFAFAVPVLLSLDIVLRLSLRRSLVGSLRACIGNFMLTVCCVCTQYSYCLSTNPGRSVQRVADELKLEMAREAQSARVCWGSDRSFHCEAGAMAKNMSAKVAAGVEEGMRGLVGKGSSYCGMLDEPRQLPLAILVTFGVLLLWSAFFNRFLRHGILLILPVQRAGPKPEVEAPAAGLGLKLEGAAKEEEEMKKLVEEKVSMSSWYTTNMVYTVSFMFVSFKIFLGRFDVRTMRASLAGYHHPENAEPAKPFAGRDDLWFDFVADTGDGFNSTYTVARSLAQPYLNVSVPCPHLLKRLRQKVSKLLHKVLPSELQNMAGGMMSQLSPRRKCNSSASLAEMNIAEDAAFSMRKEISGTSLDALGSATLSNEQGLNLPRGELLLHGGDLAYPHPSIDCYESKLIRPYAAALSPPPGANTFEVATKTKHPSAQLAKKYTTPLCWMIPGNHDWFDGLEAFLHTICGRHWFGGWHLPQTNTYWSIELPHNWFVLGFDLGLSDDIDDMQYSYFNTVVSKMPSSANVICITHGPHWYLDAYYKKESCHMYCNILSLLGSKLRILLAGDIHHYSRYSPKVSQDAPELLIAGGGGAFLHPTHINVQVPGYRRTAAYPPSVISRALALRNPFQFRRRNWAFEVFFGTVMVFAVLPALPLCGHAEAAFKAWGDGGNVFQVWLELVWQCYVRIFESTNVALVLQVGLLVSMVMVGEGQWGQGRRMLWGVPLGLTLSLCAVGVACGLELTLMGLGETGHQANRGSQAEPPLILLNLPAPWNDVGVWVFGSALAVADLPTHIFHARAAVCSVGVAEASRFSFASYILLMLPYFWVLAAPLSVTIFGSYLGLASLAGRHMDEAFSSLRIENYKSFLRMHIDTHGGLHVYSIGMDRIARQWKEDPLWRREIDSGPEPSRSPAQCTAPSRWMPVGGSKPMLVDYLHLNARSSGLPGVAGRSQAAPSDRNQYSHSRGATTG